MKEIPLLAETVIGRSPECQLRIASTEVSRRHCRVIVRADGVYVEDLGSANGTQLDDLPLPPQTPTFAAPGATLRIGPAQFAIEYTPQPRTPLDLQPFSFVDAAAMESHTIQADDTQFLEAEPELAVAADEPATKEAAKPKSLFALWGRKSKPSPASRAVPPTPSENAPVLDAPADDVPELNFGTPTHNESAHKAADDGAKNPFLNFLNQP